MKKNNEKQNGLISRGWAFVLIIICIFAVTLFTVYCCSLQRKINMKKAELAQLEVEQTELEEENAELRAMKAKGKDAENIERVAREKYGYIYPDEKVYVISP